MNKTNLPIIGSTALVSICGRENVPAKIDTGADSSSVWASQIMIGKDGLLTFCLFGKSSPFYSGKTITRKDYKVAVVRSATGEEQVRYRTYFKVTIGGKRIRMLMNLSDRSKNNFPVLIGRRSIKNKFLVDVSQMETERPKKNPKTRPLQEELRKDPRKFYKKYSNKGDNK